MTIANMITSLRILFVPALFIGANHKLGSVVWIVAAITDFLDGWIARTYKQQSALGELLDPIADKIIMAAGLILINRQYPHYWLLIPSIIIMIRDFYITKKRIVEYRQYRSIQTLSVTKLSKMKTMVLFIGILSLLIAHDTNNKLVFTIGCMLIYVSVIVSTYTLLNFMQVFKVTKNTHELRE